jgi:hypothetical protein
MESDPLKILLHFDRWAPEKRVARSAHSQSRRFHRAPCLNMLRHLGVNPLPEIHLIDSHQTLERKP